MPSGIILSSGSQGATKEDIEKVLVANGFEAEKPEAEAQAAEAIEAPKREDFKTDAEFEAAEEAHAEKLEEQEQAEEEKEAEEERKRLEALPKKTRKQRAVEKATKELNERLRKAEEKLAALEGKKPNAAKVEAPKAPKREDFDSDESFEDAQFDYRYKLRRAKEEAEAAKTSLNARLEQNFTDYKTAVETFKDEHDDWDEVVNQSIALPEAVYYAVVDLGKEGPAVTYYLGQHPEFLAELAELTPYRAAAEIGRLAEKLNPKAARKAAEGAGEKPKLKPRTSIPEPVRPVSTSATASTSTSRGAAQARDYRAFKAAQRRGA
jgi:DNA repair exonuclease SbcCD ATPase subunit